MNLQEFSIQHGFTISKINRLIKKYVESNYDEADKIDEPEKIILSFEKLGLIVEILINKNEKGDISQIVKHRKAYDVIDPEKLRLFVLKSIGVELSNNQAIYLLSVIKQILDYLQTSYNIKFNEKAVELAKRLIKKYEPLLK